MRRAPIIAALAAMLLLIFAGSASADSTVVFRTNDAWQQLLDNVILGESASVQVISGGGTVTAGNFWIDLSGGSCTRQPTAGAYIDGQACSSFDEAYVAASAGDDIVVKNGDYPAQTMDGPAKTEQAIDYWDASNDITLQGETTTGVRITGTASFPFDIHDVSELTIRDITVTQPSRVCASGASCGTVDKAIDLARTHDVDLYNVEIDRAYKVGDGLGISGEVDGTDVVNSRFHSNAEGKLIMIQSAGHSYSAHDLVLRNVDCYDQVYTATSFGGEPPHFECIWITGGPDNVLFDGVRCWLSASTGCMNWGGVGGFGGPKTNFNIYNSSFGLKYGFSGGTDVVPGAATGYRAPDGGLTIDGDNTGGSGVLDGVTIYGTAKIAGWSSLTIRNTILQNATCEGGVTYVNVIQATTCGTNGFSNGSVFTTTNFTALGTEVVEDFSAPSCSAYQVNKGSSSTYRPTDYAGTTRPVGTNSDAGLYERAGC